MTDHPLTDDMCDKNQFHIFNQTPEDCIMTQEQIQEQIIEKYGDVVLDFTGYYKFRFHYSGTASDGATIYALVGGDSDGIYRACITPTDTLESLITQACLLRLRIKEKA